MQLILDAYNILKTFYIKKDIPDRIKERFIKDLGAYGLRSSHSIILVFDGGVGERVYVEYAYPVEVVYTGYKQSADTYIEMLISRPSSQERIVVTSDRSLVRFAARYEVGVVPAAIFCDYVLYKDSKHVAEGAPVPYVRGKLRKRLHHESSGEVDALMYQAVHMIEHKDVHARIDDKERRHTIPEKQLSKSLKKIIDKL